MPDRLSQWALMAATLALILATFVLSDCSPRRATAQRIGPGHDLGLALGMLYVHEANFEGWADYPALYHAIHGRALARDVTPLQQLRAYARSIWQPRTDRQRWIALLPPSGHRPAPRGWWPVLELARGHVEDPPPNPCSGRVEHWGGPTIPIDRARARRAVELGRWVELDCGETFNAYFSVRRRIR